MAWTKTTRAQHARDHLRCASDLTEAEWALIAPDLRAVVDTLLDILTTGCRWRALPRDAFPPRSTVQRDFDGWRDTGVWERLNRRPVEQARVARGRPPCPSLAVIDSQSVATTESGGRGAPTRPSGRRGASATSSPTAPARAAPRAGRPGPSRARAPGSAR